MGSGDCGVVTRGGGGAEEEIAHVQFWAVGKF